MSISDAFDFEDWLSRWDLEAVADLDDKVKECTFFFEALQLETDRSRFRWLASAFLNAAYSFFESSALTAYFRFMDADGNVYEDREGLTVLRRHVRVVRNERNPNFVKTAGLTPLTERLYELRKKNTHHYPLVIMAAGLSLPDDFQFGTMRGEGTPVLSLYREALDVIRSVYREINS